jgi:hypothetical protein
MSKVKFDLHEMWCFTFSPDEEAEIELPGEWSERFAEISKQFFEMQGYLEHCYRQQMGLKPFKGSPFKKD